MTNTRQPENCPFCDGIAVIDYNDESKAFVQCRECGAQSPAHRDYTRAILDWNTRPEIDRLKATIEEQRSKIEELTIIHLASAPPVKINWTEVE